MPVLCEECKTNEASYTISVMVGGEITTRHLCGDCMAKMNMDIASGNIKSLLSTILSAITGDTAPGSAEKDVTCPRCGMTLSEFTRTGHLGCPKCYEAFREQLQPMLLQIHGRVQHAGRQPLSTQRSSGNAPPPNSSSGKWNRPWRWRTLKRRLSCATRFAPCPSAGRKKHERTGCCAVLPRAAGTKL